MIVQQPKTLNRKTIDIQDTYLNLKRSHLISPKSVKNKIPTEQIPFHLDQKKIICSKQNQCQFQYRPKSPHQNDDTQFSIDSELLKEQTPIQLNVQPEIQLQAKPEIDHLIATNIRRNRYTEAYKKIEKEEEERLRLQRLKKLDQSAKQALQKVKTDKETNRNKWGHSIYGQESRKALEPSEKRLQKDESIQKCLQSPNTKKATIQNAAQLAKQRIEEYKQKQIQKQKQLQKKQEIFQKQKKPDSKKVEEVNTKIANNAAEILKEKQQEMEDMKKRKEQIKKKMQQLRIASLKNCKKSRKKPVSIEQGKEEDMKMGDSQYSTFEARKEGRKMIQKVKKGKKNQRNQSNDDSKVVAQTSSRRYLKEKMSKTTANFTKKKIEKKGPSSEKENIGSKQNQEQDAGKGEFKKFYVWNVPIKQKDFSLVALNKKFQQQKTEAQQKRNEKSFKQQAEDFLRQKEMRRFQEERQKTRQEFLEQRVLEKKKQILREFQELYEQI